MPSIPLSLAVASTLLVSLPVLAGTLSCARINGNLNCAGSGAVSCQTIDGRTVCTNGSHDVMQSFGGAIPKHQSWDGGTTDDTTADADMTDGSDAAPVRPPTHSHSSGH